MLTYEYTCDRCESTFELRRPAALASAPAVCAAGHEARRVFSVFATIGRGPSDAAAPSAGGGCCGGACGCGH